MVKKTLRKVWSKKWMILGGAIVGVSVGFMFFSGGGSVANYDVAHAEYVDLTQEVSVTGTVESDTKINLKFQKSGQVNLVKVAVGDVVKKGDLLARLDTTALSLDVQSAEANVALAQANYNKMLAGSTEESIQVARAAVEKAQADLTQAQTKLTNVKNLSNERTKAAELAYKSATTEFDNAMTIYGEDLEYVYEDLYNYLDDSLNEIEDSLREVDTVLGVDNEDVDYDYEVALSSRGTGDYLAAKSAFRRNKMQYASLVTTVMGLNSGNFEALDSAAVSIKQLLNEMDDLINIVDNLLENSPAIGDFDATARSSRRSAMATELANVSTSLTGLSNVIQAVSAAKTNEATQLSSARNTLAEAGQAFSQTKVQVVADVNEAQTAVQVYDALLSQSKANLSQVSAGPRGVDLASLRASLTNAEAALSLARHNLSLGSIVAPMSGVVTRIYFDEGENVNTSDDFIEMLSSDFQVIANVSESDIAKVHVGDHVGMTLDAFYYDKTFDAEIVEIDPSETVVQGVIYYQITAAFSAEDTQVKPGMTANMDITTEETRNVLAVPIRAVKYDGARSYVVVPDPTTLGATMEADVEVGLRGDQFIEIVKGLKEGDEVVTYIR